MGNMTRSIDKVVEVLNSGGVIAYPTDTVYGIGCSIRFENAVNRINEIKESYKSKPLIVLFSSLEQVLEYITLDKGQTDAIGKDLEYEKEARKYFTRIPDSKYFVPDSIMLKKKAYKPVTHLVKNIPGNEGIIPPYVSGGLNEVAIRIPNHRMVREITERVGPITSTSANLNGGYAPTKYEDLDLEISGQVNLILKGDCIYKVSSSIISLLNGDVLRA